MAAEFLPLCDVLFNVISLAGYFCDVVFDVVMTYALLERGYTATAATALTIIILSLLISQVVSLRWYWHISDGRDGTKRRGCSRYIPYMLHCLQLGVLWRYAKLFVPVDLRYVKHEVRNLCMLRLVHAFCEAAPMLLLQLHVLAAGFDGPTGKSRADPALPTTAEERGASAAFTELNVISASLSLFSVCWALASFSKNVRLQNVHRLVLTWLGVIFQFAWRLGTISARVIALTVYASLYEHWVFLVIGLHWVSMFLWLISPKNVFHGERISRPRKAYLSALIAFVYVFAYVNLQEVNHRQKMVTFYMVMMVENCLLVCVWMVGIWGSEAETDGDKLDPARIALVPLLVLASFFAGIAFMLLYYRYFHVRRLGYELGGRLPPLSVGCADSKPVRNQFGDHNYDNRVSVDATDGTTRAYNQALYQQQRNAIPGVFNCRFSNPVGNNTATKRKKKKPTSFVPPPAAPPAPLRGPRPAPLPFWRRPLPAPHNHSHCGGSSENEGSSIGSRVNIHQKLQEKKQKQLAELKIIEEEIKQGKLANNAMISGDEIYSSLQRQPIPRTKKHIDLEPLTWAPPSPELTSLGQSFENLNTLGQNNTSHSPKLYALNNSNGHQNNGYENFSGFAQSPNNLVGQFLGCFPSYTEIPNVMKNNAGMSSINIQENYESVNSSLGMNNNRNMSPSSQISNGEQNNSLTRQILPRSKNVRQLVSGQHRPNVYPSDRQKNDRVLYGDSTGLRKLTPHLENNPRMHSFPDNNVTPRISNFSPSIGEMSRNIAYENNNKSISPRNVTNMSPKTIFTTEISGSNSFERSDNSKLMNIPRQLTSPNSNNSNHGAYHDNQSKQYPGAYNQDLNNVSFPELNNVNFRQNYDFESDLNKNDNNRNMYNEGSIMKSGISFPYQVISSSKTKLDRNGNIGNCGLNEQSRKIPRCKTTEILLAPHFLEGSSRQSCCHWGLPYRTQDNECNHQGGCCIGNNHVEVLSSGEGEPDLQGPCRAPSDIDSQISLPRSYTLPREFKYYRRNRQRRLIKPDHFVASTNSSDGDVDSCDDNESERLSNNSSKSQMNHNPEMCTKQNLNALVDIPQKYQPTKQKPIMSPDLSHQHSLSQPNTSQFDSASKIFMPFENRGCQNVSVYGATSPEFNSSKQEPVKNNSDDMNMSPSKTEFDNNMRYNPEYGIERQPFYAGVSPAHGRQLRNRMYGISKSGMVKHETKL